MCSRKGASSGIRVSLPPGGLTSGLLSARLTSYPPWSSSFVDGDGSDAARGMLNGGAMTLPDAAIGAIAASIIGGIVTLLGLIISKEQKTSEFRQAWIDGLRSDLTSYLSAVNAVCDASRVKYDDYPAKVAALGPLYERLNTATFNISLRVNPDEDLPQKILQSMKSLRGVLGGSGIVGEAIRADEAEFLRSSQQLLKSEWRRVKKGELAFTLAKLLALAVVLIAMALGVAVSLRAGDVPKAAGATTEAHKALGGPSPVAEKNVAPGALSSGATPERITQRPKSGPLSRDTASSNSAPDNPRAPGSTSP